MKSTISVISSFFSKRPDEITTRFVSVIAIFVIIGIGTLSLDRLQAKVLSAVRAYVAGEGFYSKAQKDAVNHLERYAATLKESEYQDFLSEIAVPIGDRKARLALEASPPDFAEARRGFLAGRNNPQDVERLIWLFVNFHNDYDMKRAIVIWKRADQQVSLLLDLGQRLHQEIITGHPAHAKVDILLRQVEANDRVLAGFENRFSTIMGVTSNKIDRISGILIIGATLGLLTLGIVLSAQIVKRARQAQSLLLASEARFRQVVESNIIGILFWRVDGTIYDANDAFLDLIGYSRKDLGDFTWMDISPIDFTAHDDGARSEILASGSCRPYEKAFVRKDGSMADVVVGAATLDGEPDYGVCFVLDISERRRLQERVAQAQRMEAIGTLVGGLAHNFNNTLSAMLGNIQLASLESGDNAAVRSRLDKMETLSTQSARIVHQLMAFARKSVSQLSPVSLNELAGDIHETAAASIPEHIEFNTTITAIPLTVIGDDIQLQRVMRNLIDNACDAVADAADPRISCMLDRYRQGEAVAGDPGSFDTDMAHLIVRDNGRGMSNETLSHVFEPFFTTKNVTRANGLGMSTVYGIVQSHRGDVRIESAPEKGTSIHIFLPLSSGPS